MKVYILSTYDEYGAENVHATLEPDRLTEIMDKMAESGGWTVDISPEKGKVAEVLRSHKTITEKGVDLSSGWGGLMLHIVELE